MNCQEVIEYMQRQLDLDLTEAEEGLLEEHLASCASCRTAMSRLQRLTSELANLPKVHPPVSLVDAIMPQLVEIDQASQRGKAPSDETDELMAARERKQARDRGRLSYKILGGVVAASLLLGVVIVNLNQDTSQHMAADTEGSSSDANYSLMSNQAVDDAEHKQLEMQSKMMDTASSSDEVGIQEYVPSEPYTNRSGYEVMEEHSMNGMLGFAPKDNTAASGDRASESSPEAPIDPQAEGTQEWASRGHKEETVSSSSGVPGFEADLVELIDQYGVSSGYPSPDGAYSAYIENGAVVILDTEHEKIYTSQSFTDAEIYDLSWQDDSRITFKIVVDSEEEAYYIDLEERTEGTL